MTNTSTSMTQTDFLQRDESPKNALCFTSNYPQKTTFTHNNITYSIIFRNSFRQFDYFRCFPTQDKVFDEKTPDTRTLRKTQRMTALMSGECYLAKLKKPTPPSEQYKLLLSSTRPGYKAITINKTRKTFCCIVLT